MIKMHKELIAILHKDRGNLAYMTHKEFDKDGEPLKAYLSRKDTGDAWSYNSGKYVEFNNDPVSGFEIVGAMSRWSTQNKVIRVEDPRGFTVEIPTDNLTTLLKHCTVNKGVVAQECVWGRDGSNHILLPTNSSIYEESINQNEQHSEMVSFSKLDTGSIVKMSVDDDREWIYLGRAKAVWERREYQATQKEQYYYYGGSRYSVNDSDSYKVLGEFSDNKYCFIFKSIGEKKSWQNDYDYKPSGKAFVTTISKQIIKRPAKFKVRIPERVSKDVANFWDEYKVSSSGIYYRFETIKFIWKDGKK